jgi:diguanylate cyclase (GGDEF)-like protein/PAS domain S-box-containing protein
VLDGLGQTQFSQESIRQIFDQSPDPYWIIDPDSSAFLHANKESEKQLGFSLAELLRCKIGVVDVNVVVSTPEKWNQVASSIGQGQTFRYLADLRCKSGDVVAVEITISRLVVEKRDVFFAVTRDISNIAAIELQLREREHLLKTVFQTMTEGVVVVDADNRCVLSNRRIADLLAVDGRRFEDAEWRTVFDSLHVTGEQPVESDRKPFGELLQTRHPITDLLLRGRFPNDQTKWLIANASPLDDETLQGSVLTLTDVSEVRRSQARIDYMSMTDMLTDLPNRSRLLAELDAQIKRCMEDSGWVALLVVDLDRFKLINETHGHSAGDHLLQRLSDRLRAHVPPKSLLARTSADEFGLVLRINAANLKEARREAESIAASLSEAILRPFVTRYEPIQICASIGIVLTEGSTVNSDTVLQYGGLALARAKEAGGDCWRIFDPSMLEGPKSRYYAESALRDGVRANEFELFFQPKIELRTGKLKGAEALIRWNRLGQGTIGPEFFIGVAERSNLIVSLGEFVVRDACRAVNRLRGMGLMSDVGMISINVSPRQFQQSDFVPRLKAILQEADVDPRHFCIELTETALADDAQHVVSSLRLLKSDGFGVSIDDFGSGYSSFAHLQQFPINELKIDKSFISEIERSERGLAIVRAMLAMAKALGLSVVAEGIEKPEQRQLLLDNDCESGQGYFFARPMPLNEFIEWVINHLGRG